MNDNTQISTASQQYTLHRGVITNIVTGHKVIGFDRSVTYDLQLAVIHRLRDGRLTQLACQDNVTNGYLWQSLFSVESLIANNP